MKEEYRINVKSLCDDYDIVDVTDMSSEEMEEILETQLAIYGSEPKKITHWEFTSDEKEIIIYINDER